jgi:choline dehydrogenase-like flavoprotein
VYLLCHGRLMSEQHGLFPGQPGDPGAEYMNILTNVISPVSRGEVSLASSDPFAHPIINPNLLGSDFDKYVLTYALKAARRYASSAAFKGYAVNPAAAYGGATSDADLEAYAATYSGT